MMYPSVQVVLTKLSTEDSKRDCCRHGVERRPMELVPATRVVSPVRMELRREERRIRVLTMSMTEALAARTSSVKRSRSSAALSTMSRFG